MGKCSPIRLSLFLPLLAIFATAAWGQDTGPAASYRIGPNDLVSVEVLEDPTLDTETRVSRDGTIVLPHVDPVAIGGLNSIEAARVLGQALEKYLQRATVRLRIVEYRSHPITLLGAVNKPGTLPFSGRWTLIEALTQAGGLSENAGDAILVLRRASNGLSDQMEIDRRDLLERGNANVNITLFPNDLINIPVASNVTVLLLGEVASPGAIVFKSTDRVTLLAAIARAGGRTERASNQLVVRSPESDEEIAVNYKKLLAGTQPDLELSDGDLVIVKESFF